VVNPAVAYRKQSSLPREICCMSRTSARVDFNLDLPRFDTSEYLWQRLPHTTRPIASIIPSDASRFPHSSTGVAATRTEVSQMVQTSFYRNS
jgi:hypothetical protein